jgi:hypothetical protein
MSQSTATATQLRTTPDRHPVADRHEVAGRPATADGHRSRLRVAPPVPVSAPKAPFVALVLVVVVAGVLGILVLNTKITENAFQLAHLEHQQNGLDEREAQLNQQLADDRSPTNVAAKGRALGLVGVGQPAFMTLPNGAVFGVPQPALGVPDAVGQHAGAQPSVAASAAAGH